MIINYNNGTLYDNGHNFVESANTGAGSGGFTNGTNDAIVGTDPTGLASSLSYEGGYSHVLAVTSGNLTTAEAAGSTSISTDQEYYRKSGTIYYGTGPTSATNYITRGAYQYYGVVARTNTVNDWTSGSNIYYTEIQGAENDVSSGATVNC